MKILAVSDIVDPLLYPNPDVEAFSSISLILSCGDLPPEFLSFLVARFNVPLYYVCGNHDFRYNLKPPDGGTNANARLIRFRGHNILGLGGSRWYNGGPFQYKEREMRKTIRKLKPRIWWRNGLDIVFTHAPPRHIHDQADRCHKGFMSFRQLIDKYRPAYFIHGHIHARFSDPSQRVTRVNDTKVVNACGYVLLEIEDERPL
jgi:Icc-related predicted phosphoesterase